MAKKNATQMQPVTASLMVSREDFKRQLAKRIDLGRQLLARDVPLQGERSFYSGYNRMPSQPPLTQEQERFLSDFNRWINYNNELLTQSFDHPRSRYQQF